MSEPAAPRARRLDVALKVRLRYPNRETFEERFAVNISRSGIFIRSSNPPPPGTRVQFEYTLEDDTRLMKGIGIVRWTRTPAEDDLPGMGVEFVDLDPQTEELITTMVARYGEGSRAPQRERAVFRAEQVQPATSVGLGHDEATLDPEEESALDGLLEGDAPQRPSAPSTVTAPPLEHDFDVELDAPLEDLPLPPEPTPDFDVEGVDVALEEAGDVEPDAPRWADLETGEWLHEGGGPLPHHFTPTGALADDGLPLAELWVWLGTPHHACAKAVSKSLGFILDPVAKALTVAAGEPPLQLATLAETALAAMGPASLVIPSDAHMKTLEPLLDDRSTRYRACLLASGEETVVVEVGQHSTVLSHVSRDVVSSTQRWPLGIADGDALLLRTVELRFLREHGMDLADDASLVDLARGELARERLRHGHREAWALEIAGAPVELAPEDLVASVEPFARTLVHAVVSFVGDRQSLPVRLALSTPLPFDLARSLRELARLTAGEIAPRQLLPGAH